MPRLEKKKSALAIMAALGALTGQVSPRAWAQQTGPSTEVLPPVTVTAEKREQRLQDVPAAVQAFGGEELERTGVRDLQDVIRNVPGASQGRSTQIGTRSFQIRGVSSFYGDSTVGYYLDDAVFTILNRNWAPLGRTFDVNRVEVLRGPQGTLYGLGSMGGTVRFITEDPDLKRFRATGGAGISWTDGGDPNSLLEAAFSVPIVEDRFALRVTASDYRTGGFTDSPTFPGELNETTSRMYRIKALAKPDRNWTIRLGHQHGRDEDPLGGQLEYIAVPPPGTLTGRYPASTLGPQTFKPYNNTKLDATSLLVAYDAGPVTIESSSGYVSAWQSARVPVNGLLLNTGLDASTLSSELRAISNSPGPLRWIVGALYMQAESAETANLVAVTPPPARPLLGPLYSPIRNDVPTYDSDSYAIYGQVSYDFGPWTPLIGLRYFHDNRTFTDNQFLHTVLPIGAPGPCAIPVNAAACIVQPSVTQSSANFSSVSPRFNLSYRIDKDSISYINIAKGFRSGVFNTVTSVALTGVSQAVDPDTLWSYEWGAKSGRLFGLNVTAEASLYYLDWKDVQLNYNAPGFPPPPPQVISNVGNVKGYGLDYGISWAPTPDWLLSVSGNFNSTEWDSINNPRAFANTHFVVGEQLTTVPESTVAFSATYRHSLPWQNLTGFAFLSYQYIGKQGDPSSVGSGPATRPAPFGNAQKLLNMRLGVEAFQWSAYLVGTNLLNHDEPYYISGSGYQVNYPRTIGIEARLHY